MPPRIIFLCTGNICRSPLAEVLASEIFSGTGVEFASAGLNAVPGLPASVSSVAYAAAKGLTLAGHRSQPVRPELLAGTAWCIGMTRSHAAIFRSRFGAGFAGAIGILGAPGLDLSDGAMSPAVEEVDDPYGLSQERYFSCGDQISRLLRPWSAVWDSLTTPPANSPQQGTDTEAEL